MGGLWRHRYGAVDLFSGCGGLSLGLRRAGFRILAAIDNDDLATGTYRLNHRTVPVFSTDIRKLDSGDLMERCDLKRGDLDLLAGCPPCQGFSTLRTLNGGRRVEEESNDLVFEFLRFAENLLPRTIMMENVPALLFDRRFDVVRQKLEGLGYSCVAEVLDAQDYGVPQRRRRMIMLAARDGVPELARKVGRRRTVRGAIGRMGCPEVSDDELHNYPVRRSPRILHLIGRIPRDGGGRTDLPRSEQLPCHRNFSGFRDIYGRMAWHEPSPTITGGCINPSKGRFLHPEQDRAVTLREGARLQGFPGSYRFATTRGRYAVAQMIGNAFPPKFAEHHARSLYGLLKDVKG